MNISEETFRRHEEKDDKVAEENRQSFQNIERRMNDSEEERRKRHEEVVTMLKDMSERNDPLIEIYTTATRLGKWLIAFMTFVSILIAILAGLKKIL